MLHWWTWAEKQIISIILYSIKVLRLSSGSVCSQHVHKFWPFLSLMFLWKRFLYIKKKLYLSNFRGSSCLEAITALAFLFFCSKKQGKNLNLYCKQQVHLQVYSRWYCSFVLFPSNRSVYPLSMKRFSLCQWNILAFANGTFCLLPMERFSPLSMKRFGLCRCKIFASANEAFYP